MFNLQFIAEIIVELIVLASYLVIASFLIWMFVDAAKQDRFWWIVIILGVPVIGAAVYYLTEKKHQYAIAPVHHVHDSETESQHEKSPKSHKTEKGKSKKEEVVVVEESKVQKEEAPPEEDKKEIAEEIEVEKA